MAFLSGGHFLTSSHCKLRSNTQGSTEINIKEWQEVVDHKFKHLPKTWEDSFAAAAKAEVVSLFWSEVDKLSHSERQKLLYYWCSMLPPAGGLSTLKATDRLQLVRCAFFLPWILPC